MSTTADRTLPFRSVQSILPSEEAEEIMTNFWRKYPRGVCLELSLLGFHYDETEASEHAILSSLHVVSFHPETSSRVLGDEP